MTLTDTGPVVALIDTNEAKHQVCRLALSHLAKPMIMTWACYTEAMYLLGRELGYPGQQALWRLRTAGPLKIHESSEVELVRMESLMAHYRDTPMDLADASLVAAAETIGVRRVFTLDHHFYS